MNEARPFASLSSGLLARKGAAKPAMRPQGFTGGFEDLGWNDMGHEPSEEIDGELPEHVPSSIAALTPAPKHPVQADSPEPEVVAQQRAIAESFEPEEAEAPPPVQAPAPVVRLPKRPAVAAAPAAQTGGRKAAFTLRLDGDRHLRLRLANAVTGRSAQQIVTEALDRFLASIPEVEALAERVPASGGKRS
ncbi:MAG TPA: hypothetical protein VK614_12245 [Allosphingosinicella sp.]|nr:hypothetical protein [Allosphingosinicella sp.]